MGDEDDVVFCDDCGDIFLSKVDLDLHTRTIHSVSLTFHHMVGLSPPTAGSKLPGGLPDCFEIKFPSPPSYL